MKPNFIYMAFWLKKDKTLQLLWAIIVRTPVHNLIQTDIATDIKIKSFNRCILILFKYSEVDRSQLSDVFRMGK